MREGFDDAQWHSYWTETKDWSQQMIYKREPPAVVRAVADSFDELQCWEQRPFEPLHLDAVFHAKNSRSWFPIQVAIEHENDSKRFPDEIRKLLSIRSRLKVGITYALIGEGSQSDLQRRVEGDIRREFADANALPKEDGTTEYLFLLGCEIDVRELLWRKWIFNGAIGPGSQAFQ